MTFTTETNVATWDPLDETGLRIPKHRCRFWSNGEEVKGDFRGSTEKIIVDRAINFMRDAIAKDKPFMTTIWFYGPHSPTRAGQELRDLYRDQPLGRQHYLGSITAVDNEVGRIRKALGELGAEENTLIFFCSDNGPEGSGDNQPAYDAYHGAYYGSAGTFKGRKRFLYNGGVCVPAFAYWPAVIKPGRVADSVACTLDYLPTIADLLGYKMPDDRPIDGTTLVPLLNGEGWKRTSLVPFASNTQQQSPSVAIIDGDYKLLVWLGSDKPAELYQVSNDPAENRNLAANKPELVTTMRAKLEVWLKSARHSYDKGDYPGHRTQGRFVRGYPGKQ